ncbi:hypothetical protein CPRG_00205 [Synechococcus phage Syn30]|uniref:Uncharacterized protein n=1 Tax=Synechococcus phage Syn30 TaxID=536474 RepID=M4SJY9_9CAUD|nr:virion structural protein [Synechococcus phage Syn30]AGH56288.1 hypothetical protein CPRG_00205 [Synechococcus phage Syn30]|tara:strand:+ start:46326 stop:46565 length:240 start_codon:yes stop_codon:yes gene_type:complete
MSEKWIVEEDHDWSRDSHSGSIELTSDTEYEKYMRSYREAQKKKEEFKTLQNDVSGLKSEMSDIKSLLLTLVQNQEKTS